LVVFPTGCSGDGEAILIAPESLAVGAYAPLAIGDRCQGGKLDFCGNEGVTSVTAVSVENPRVLEVVPLDALPPELSALAQMPMPGAQKLVRGLGRGSTSVCLTASFDDGEERRACATVAVGVPDNLVISPGCRNVPGAKDETPTLVAPGTSVSFTVELWENGKALGGVVPTPLENADVTRGGPMSFTWASPAEGGTVELRSAHVPADSELISTIEPLDVDGLLAGIPRLPPLVLYPGETLDVTIDDTVGENPTCEDLPTVARSDSPDVCLGPNGEESWTGGSDTEISAVASGDCRLSLGVVGGAGFVGTLEAPLVVLDPAEKAREADVNEECPTPGLTACGHSRYYELVCRTQGNRSLWTLGTRCEDAICTFTAPEGECSGDCTECR
jgi:hypothetical protein